jgi:ascorbate PTS system EIIA or EIIAB component
MRAESVDAPTPDARMSPKVSFTSAPPDQRRLSLSNLLPVSAIRLKVRAADWRDAVSACGEALVAGGITTPAYTDQMIATVEQLGPYLVIAPGIALAHARPSVAVLRPGLSWVTLAQPVRFGHKDNDPVTLVVGLAAPDDYSHVQALATLAGLLEDANRRAALLALQTPPDVLAAIVAFEETRETDTPGEAK